MLRKTILSLALLCAWSVAQAMPPTTPSPIRNIQHVEKLIADRQLDEATQSIKILIRQDPGNAKLHYYLAQVHAANNNWLDADLMLQKAKYFDWTLRFASNKKRVVALEEMINEQKYRTTLNTQTAVYREYVRSEKKSYDIQKTPTKELITGKQPQLNAITRTSLHSNIRTWTIMGILGIIGAAWFLFIQRVKTRRTREIAHLASASLKEQKIVLFDLRRVLNDIEVTSKSENLVLVHRDITVLLERVSYLINELHDHKIQSIQEIEESVKKTQLYRKHCHELQDSRPVVLN